MMQQSLFEGPNPLIDHCSADTLANIQAMLGRIQALQIDLLWQNPLNQESNSHASNQCPGGEFYLRLLLLVQDAIEHEIEKVTDPSLVHQYASPCEHE